MYRLSKITIQLLSHNWPKDRRDALFKDGKMYAVLAFSSVSGIGSNPFVNEFILDMSGSCTKIGSANYLFCKTIASLVQK